MKKINIAILVLISLLITICSCTNTNKQTDLPDAVDSFTNYQWDQESINIIDRVEASTSVEDAKQILMESGLSDKIISYLSNKNGGVSKLEYNFLQPNGDTLIVTDTIGTELRSMISQQRLVVIITYSNGQTEIMFVKCLNGLVSKVSFKDEDFIGMELYTLNQNQGPMHYGATWDDLWNMVYRFNTGSDDLQLYFHAYKKDGHRVKINLSNKDRLKKATNEYTIKISKGNAEPSSRIQLEPGDRFRKNMNGNWEFLPN